MTITLGQGNSITIIEAIQCVTPFGVLFTFLYIFGRSIGRKSKSVDKYKGEDIIIRDG